MNRVLLVAFCTAMAGFALAAPADGLLIASMDELVFTAPKGKGKAELVEGKVGKAVRFSFDKDARAAFFTSNLRGTPAWDKAAGFSFWVRGDGTDQFAGLQLIYNDDYALRYDLCFLVKGKDWQKVTVAWSDLVPVLPGPKAKPLGAEGNPPSKVSALWFGKWWYWSDYPPYTFTVDEIRLEPTIERDSRDYKPEGNPLARVEAKLKAGKPVTVVTMGDSLTDARHHANRKTNWPALLAEKLKARAKSEVTIHNPAIGGTQLRQNLVLMPRWLNAAPEPDLVNGVVWRERLGVGDARTRVRACLCRSRGPHPPGDARQGRHSSAHHLSVGGDVGQDRRTGRSRAKGRKAAERGHRRCGRGVRRGCEG